MNKIVTACLVAALSVLLSYGYVMAESHASPGKTMKQEGAGSAPTGEYLFKNNCAVCHRDGGNVINPEKTLHAGDLNKAGIKTPEDIIKIMRNPGPGMQTFSETDISDEDAKKLAEYIFETFK